MFRRTDPQTTLGALDVLPSPKRIARLERRHRSGFLRENHNLRSMRQAELADNRPTHVVCAWMGHSPPVVQEHYLPVTGDRFDRAALPSHAVRNPVQHRPQGIAPSRTPSRPISENRSIARLCETMRSRAMTAKYARWSIQDLNLWTYNKICIHSSRNAVSEIIKVLSDF